VVAKVGKARRQHQPDMATADDGDPAWFACRRVRHADIYRWGGAFT
jgi:hypothetical protein